MTFPLIAAALGFAELVPAIGRLLRPGKKATEDALTFKNTLDTADKILDLARKVTGEKNPQDSLKTLKENPEMLVRFQECVTQLEQAQIEAEVQDRISARARDLSLARIGRVNRRADIMVISAALGLVGCLVCLGLYKSEISGEAVGILSTIAGVFGACLKDAFSFEFGAQRELRISGGKDLVGFEPEAK